MPTILCAVLSFLSVAISAGFLWAGWLMLLEAEADLAMYVFGCAAGLYGIGSIFLLGTAWLKPTKNLSPAMKLLAGAALAGVIVGSLDVGMISGLEWGLTLTIGAVLWGQLYSLHYISERTIANKRL